MKRPSWVALGWTVAVQSGLALILVGIWLFLIDPMWLAQNFLQPDLLNQLPAYLEDYLSKLRSALITTAILIFVVNILCCAVWHVWGGHSRIDGPGQAARLWIRWLALLVIGVVLSGAAVYYYLRFDILVRADALAGLYITAAILSVVFYFIGTLFPTEPKLRPGVPLGTLMPPLPGYERG